MILAASASDAPTWIAVAVAVLSAAGAVAAAVVAGRSAARSKQIEIEAARRAELERRLGAARPGVFEPFVNSMTEFFDAVAQDKDMTPEFSDQVLGKPLREFAKWVQVYGDDDTLRAVMRLMQASYKAAPPLVLIRLLGDVILALRHELGDPETDVTVLELLAVRMGDAFTEPTMTTVLSEPLDQVCKDYKWSAPWAQEPAEHKTLTAAMRTSPRAAIEIPR